MHSRGTKEHICAFLSSGLAVGVGLYTTFLYVNKSIQTQVFLQVRESRVSYDFGVGDVVNPGIAAVPRQERRSKLQCIWLLLFLGSSSLLLYYTFYVETLYYW